MKCIRSLCCAMAALLLLAGSRHCLASYPDITGPWSGMFTITANGSANKASMTMTASISNQVGGNFDIQLSLGGFSVLSGDQGPLASVLEIMGVTPGGTGYFSTSDKISFSIKSIDGNYSLTGTADLDGNTAMVHLNMNQSLNSVTVSDGSGTLRRGQGLIEPAIAPSSEVVYDVNELGQAVFGLTSLLSGRTTGLRNKAASGFRITGSGLTIGTSSGIASGDTLENIGAWAGYLYSDFDNDFFRTKYDGDRHTVLVGVDFSPKQEIVLGVAVGYEHSEVDTEFNRGEIDADGWIIAPYFGLLLDDAWSFDVNGGYSSIETDQFRTAGDTRITSTVDTDRWFVSVNVNGFKAINNWLLAGRAGIMHAQSEDDDFTELNTATGVPAATIAGRTTKLTQLSIGGEAAYSMGNFEPFVGATYNYDASATETRLTAGSQPSNDDDDVVLGFGVHYFNDDNNLSASAQYNTRLSRDDFSEGVLSFNGRWDF